MGVSFGCLPTGGAQAGRALPGLSLQPGFWNPAVRQRGPAALLSSLNPSQFVPLFLPEGLTGTHLSSDTNSTAQFRHT